MTSNEEHVYRHIREARWLSFFPVGRAKIFESVVENENETVYFSFHLKIFH